jgi:hypothetical protein
MTSWPNWRSRIPRRAISGSACISPKTLRVAGSCVHAEQQVRCGEVEEAQRVRLQDLAEVGQPPLEPIAAGGIVDRVIASPPSRRRAGG